MLSHVYEDHQTSDTHLLTSSQLVTELHADHQDSRRDPYSAVRYKDDLTSSRAGRLVAGSPVATVRNLRYSACGYYMCIWMCVCVGVRTCMYACIRICMIVCVCVCVHIHVYVYTLWQM